MFRFPTSQSTVHRSLSALCVLLSILFRPASAGAQDKFTLKIAVDLVELNVSVVDEQDRGVGGLQKEHFRVREDGVDQDIAVFKQEDLPISLGLVIDTSRSMEPHKGKVDEAALAFVRRGNSQDETFIIHFESFVTLAQDFTGDIELLEKSLADNRPFGQTALYDALFSALARITSAHFDRRAILVFSDGADNVSQHSFEEVLERVKQTRVAVYALGLLEDTPNGRRAADQLRKLADAAGGRAFFPQTSGEVQAIAERIARELRERYTIGYVPTNARRDGTWRSVRVEVLLPPGSPRLLANYRHGYYAPEK